MRRSDRAEATPPWRRLQGLTLTTVLAIFASSSLATLSATTTTGTTETSRATTITTTGTTTLGMGCSGIQRCLAQSQCATCVSILNDTVGFPHSLAEYDQIDYFTLQSCETKFFQALLSTSSCSTSATPPNIIRAALQDLVRHTENSCISTYRMSLSHCAFAEYTCFVDNDCRQCLDAVHAASESGDTYAEALSSPACSALILTNPALLNHLAQFCKSTMPLCSMYKRECSSSSGCASCLDALNGGDGMVAALQCRGTQQSALTLDNLVKNCYGSNPVACSFWHQRCADKADCGPCLALMGNGDSARAIATDWSAPDCQRVDSYSRTYLINIANECPSMSTCRSSIADCVSLEGEACLACLNGSAPPASESCDHFSRKLSTSLLPLPRQWAVFQLQRVSLLSRRLWHTAEIAFP
jgi:hypothetical protein